MGGEAWLAAALGDRSLLPLGSTMPPIEKDFAEHGAEQSTSVGTARCRYPVRYHPATMTNGNAQELNISQLEQWLWDAACVIRGALDAPKYKDYILPLVFLKRLSDVFDDEIAHLAHEYGSSDAAKQFVELDHGLVRFFVPEDARWPAILRRTTGVGEYLTDVVRAVARENPELQGVIDAVDFNATTAGQRIVDDDRLGELVQVLNRHRLGLEDVEPDIFGRAYEYLLRKFAEGQGQSAGEFLTPREVGVLIARLLNPEPGMEVYDPTCGTGGLLIKAHLRLLEKYGQRVNDHLVLPPEVAPLRLFGQEFTPATYAIAHMNAAIHDLDAQIALGDTMRRPAFTEGDTRLRRFDLVTANPMWNQKFVTTLYEHDPYGRFTWGFPPYSSADWGWLQHMVRSLKDGGRIAVVIDTGAVARGSGNRGSNHERAIRKEFVERDLIEAVLLLPENLFYNMTGAGVIVVINTQKQHPDEILLINGSKHFEKGRPKNFLPAEQVEALARLYEDWRAEDGVSAIISRTDAAANDYNLSPSRYVASNGTDDVLPLEEALVLLDEAEEERARGDEELDRVLRVLGLR